MKRCTQKSKIARHARVRVRARVAERTRGEEAVLYIDALPEFLKIVVGFREKVDGFSTLCDGDAKIQFVQRFSSS